MVVEPDKIIMALGGQPPGRRVRVGRSGFGRERGLKVTREEMIAKISELKELKLMKDDLDAEIAAVEDVIKAEMGSDEELVAGPYKVTWKSVTSSRLDTTALKKAFPAEALAPYTKTTTTRRFCVN